MLKFFRDARRVITVAKKPDLEEYKQVAKVSGIGIVLIGFVGFIITLINWIIQGILPTT